MRYKKLLGLAGVLICIVTLTGIVLAMSSDSFRLDWFTQLTGGGGHAVSARYAVNTTIGQTVIGASDSASYESCLGYWCGTRGGYSVKLPVIMNHFSP